MKTTRFFGMENYLSSAAEIKENERVSTGKVAALFSIFQSKLVVYRSKYTLTGAQGRNKDKKAERRERMDDKKLLLFIIPGREKDRSGIICWISLIRSLRQAMS